MWQEGLVIAFVITYFMWQFWIVRRNSMDKLTQPDRCHALTVDEEQCSRRKLSGKKICCQQHDDLVYAGPKRLALIDEDERDPYAEGADAGMEGDNPYPPTSNQGLSWNDGFISTHSED